MEATNILGQLESEPRDVSNTKSDFRIVSRDKTSLAYNEWHMSRAHHANEIMAHDRFLAATVPRLQIGEPKDKAFVASNLFSGVCPYSPSVMLRRKQGPCHTSTNDQHLMISLKDQISDIKVRTLKMAENKPREKNHKVPLSRKSEPKRPKAWRPISMDSPAS
uniref:Uncharacterized protein n=1 Tax=Vespula pensylvanica TaxID=30213 RepID=A0A834NYJ2_VESPE|nr:hypothetical protein H0235_009287 [Vespula pensylvanica]